MPELTQNIGLLSPEFALAGLALAILAIDLFLPDDKKKLTPWLSAAGLAGIIGTRAKVPSVAPRRFAEQILRNCSPGVLRVAQRMVFSPA